VAARLIEIARIARVSVATVSRALNGQPGVGERTRRRIRTLASQMNYRPHANARALVTGHSPFLGLVVPDITNPFFPSLARGAEEEAFCRGYSLLLLNTNWDQGRLRQAFDLLDSRRVGGLLLALPPAPEVLAGRDPDLLSRTVVMAGVQAPAETGIRSVTVDDREGGAMVARHLLEQGYRRIGFVGGPRQDPSCRHRHEGFLEVLSRAGRTRLGPVSFGEWSVESGYRQAKTLLGRRNWPDALFAANDLLALGVAEAMREVGLAPGPAMGLVGYDDIESVRWTAVPISSVAQPEAEVGREAVRRLIALILGQAPEPDTRLVPRLSVRASSRRFPDPPPAPEEEPG